MTRTRGQFVEVSLDSGPFLKDLVTGKEEEKVGSVLYRDGEDRRGGDSGGRSGL